MGRGYGTLRGVVDGEQAKEAAAYYFLRAEATTLRDRLVGSRDSECRRRAASTLIPFNKLMLSQSNVRRIVAGVSTEELAEDIARRIWISEIMNW
jgi:hypothetical protein